MRMADADASTNCAGGASRGGDGPVLRQAGTAIVLRPRARGRDGAFEILLVRRRHTMAFMANAFVFPGGAVDTSDADARAAAARELQEEAGLRLPVEALAPWSHWITPSFEPKRFSAHFFVATAPADQDVVIDGAEITEAQWLAPADAVAHREALLMPPPQQLFCFALAQFHTLAQVTRAAHAAPNALPFACVEPVLPRLGQFDEGAAILLPWDAAYDAAGKGAAHPWPEAHTREVQQAQMPSRFWQRASGYFSMAC